MTGVKTYRGPWEVEVEVGLSFLDPDDDNCIGEVEFTIDFDADPPTLEGYGDCTFSEEGVISTLIGLATVMVTTLVIAWRTAKMITKHMIPTQPDVIVVEGNSETLNPQFGDPDFNQQNESIEKFYEKLPGSELQEFQP